MFCMMSRTERPNTIFYFFYNDIPFGLLLEHLEHTDTESLIFIALVYEVLVDAELRSCHGFSRRYAGQVKTKLSLVLMIETEVFI